MELWPKAVDPKPDGVGELVWPNAGIDVPPKVGLAVGIDPPLATAPKPD